MASPLELICISVRPEQWQAKGLTCLMLPAPLSIKLANSKQIFESEMIFTQALSSARSFKRDENEIKT